MRVYDFIIENGFSLEMLLCTMLFVTRLKRRSFFVLRVAAVAVAVVGSSILLNMIPWKSSYIEFTKYLVIFAVLTAGILFCFNTSLLIALFCETGASATQHAAFKLGDLARYLIGLSALNGTAKEAVSAILYIFFSFTVYVVSYFLFARRFKKDETGYMRNIRLLPICIALITFASLFQRIFAAYSDGIALWLFIIFFAYGILSCVFTLSLQYGLFQSGKLEQEKKIMEQILHLQKMQFEASRENIELINIKCHDLKKQLALLGDRITKEEIRELEHAVSIYDFSIMTGNEVLDIILAEKSLVCEKENIKIECIADGGCLNFMTASDIYSLFGNAVDNAIEAVQKIEDTEKRVISISVKETMGMITIHLQNFYAGDLQIVDDLPRTTKSDENYHGFGMRSIRMLVEKYGGHFSVKTKDGVFYLNVLIPQR